MQYRGTKEESTKAISTRRSFLRKAFIVANSFYLGPLFAESSSETAVLDLKVYDSATGRIVPCSIAIRTSDGKLITDNPGYRAGIRSSGIFHSPLPVGITQIVITRGFDYQSQARELLLQPGKTTECVIHLTRVSPLSREGWVCGDNHVHMRHDQGGILIDLAFVALSARAEALDYMSVAQYWNVSPATPAILSRDCAEVSTPDCVLHWNIEVPKNYWGGNVSHCMGHCWTLGIRDTLPDGKDPIAELLAMSAWDYEKEKTSFPNFESHALIHSAGGIAVYTHPLRFRRGTWGGRNGFPVEQDKFVSNMAQELPFDTVAGPTYDGIDIMMQTKERMINQMGEQLWFMLLNHGYRIPATASSDTTFNVPGNAVPGAVRVYTKIDGPLAIDKVASGVRSGHNFVTSGPLLDFAIDGYRVGDVIPASTRKRRGHVRVWASGAPGERLTRITVLRGGEPYKNYKISGEASFYDVEFYVAEEATTWYIVKCHGARWDQVAISNPIYFESSDYQPPKPAEASVTLTVRDVSSGTLLNGTYEIVEMIGRDPHIVSTGNVVDGKAVFAAPATARIRVSAPSYLSRTKSIFMDTPALVNLITEIQPQQILDWSTYEEIRRVISAISFDFELKRSQ